MNKEKGKERDKKKKKLGFLVVMGVKLLMGSEEGGFSVREGS